MNGPNDWQAPREEPSEVSLTIRMGFGFAAGIAVGAAAAALALMADHLVLFLYGLVLTPVAGCTGAAIAIVCGPAR
jgi:hypothetical protein